MQELGRRNPDSSQKTAHEWARRFWILAVWAFAVGLAVCWLQTEPNIEVALIHVFGAGRHGDAFDGVNGVCGFFIVVMLTSSALLAWLYLERKRDALIVLSIGPGLGLIFLAVGSDLSDPAWMTNLAVLSISTAVGCATGTLCALIRR